MDGYKVKRYKAKIIWFLLGFIKRHGTGQHTDNLLFSVSHFTINILSLTFYHQYGIFDILPSILYLWHFTINILSLTFSASHFIIDILSLAFYHQHCIFDILPSLTFWASHFIIGIFSLTFYHWHFQPHILSLALPGSRQSTFPEACRRKPLIPIFFIDQ